MGCALESMFNLETTNSVEISTNVFKAQPLASRFKAEGERQKKLSKSPDTPRLLA